VRFVVTFFPFCTLHGACRLVACKFFFWCGGMDGRKRGERVNSRSLFFYRKKNINRTSPLSTGKTDQRANRSACNPHAIVHARNLEERLCTIQEPPIQCEHGTVQRFNCSQPLSIWWEEQWSTRPRRLQARQSTMRRGAAASSTTLARVLAQPLRRGSDADASGVGVARSKHSTTTVTTSSWRMDHNVCTSVDQE
jgi:hypothetical protein